MQSLYDKYKNAMFTLAYRISNDEALASDILQATFITVFDKLVSFRQEATLGSWIKKILLRKAFRKVKQEDKYDKVDIENNDTIIEWQDNLTGEYLHKAIESLPTGYRKVFVLIEVEGYSHKEVGEMMGISVGTSKSQLFHSKKMLQKKLADLI